MTELKMKRYLNYILIAGVIISVILVLYGASFFLIHYGSEYAADEFVYVEDYRTNLTRIIRSALSFSPLGMIELGLIVLVATQIVRVAVLVLYYLKMRDHWFTLISLFIFCVLCYGFFFK